MKGDKGKGAAAAKKAAPGGKTGGAGGKVTMEEITDNRPRTVNYVFDFAE
jgi:hypothetical protein